jgi:hypothetical protein
VNIKLNFVLITLWLTKENKIIARLQRYAFFAIYSCICDRTLSPHARFDCATKILLEKVVALLSTNYYWILNLNRLLYKRFKSIGSKRCLNIYSMLSIIQVCRSGFFLSVWSVTEKGFIIIRMPFGLKKLNPL